MLYSSSNISKMLFHHVNFYFSEPYYNESYFTFKLQFRQTKFKEIRQIRAYDLESLYGDIGGYMGLLLGYSILNLPSMIAFCYGIIKKTLLDRERLIPQSPIVDKMNAESIDHNSQTMLGKATIVTDTAENGEDILHKLSASNDKHDLMIEKLHKRLMLLEDHLR